MLKLSELTVQNEQALLYIERFEYDYFEMKPKTLIETVEKYILNDHSPRDEIDKFEKKINEVLKKYKNYIAGEYVDNDIY